MKRENAPELPEWLAAQLPFERYRLSLGQHAIHVMEKGHGRPVVLLHGNPTWGFLWRKVAKELPGNRFRLIIPDLVGLGLSSRPTDPGFHTVANHGRLIAQLFDALDIRDAIFVGQDWGGPIGIEAFRHEAHRLAGMVILNTVLSEPRPNFKPTLFHRLAHAPGVGDLLFRGLAFPQNMLWIAQGDRSSIRGRTRAAYTYPLRRLSDRDAPLALARMVPDSLEHPSVGPLRDIRAFVEQLNIPSAMVWGDNDPVLGGAFNWVRTLVRPFHIVRTDAGHFLQEEVPTPIAEAIEAVADALEGKL